MRRLLSFSPFTPSPNESIDIVQGVQDDWDEDLGMTSRRDPDALPPSNRFQVVMHWINDLVTSLGRGNALFAIKAGLLTVILCIPSFLKKTAAFAYGAHVYSPFSAPPVLHTEFPSCSSSLRLGNVR